MLKTQKLNGEPGGTRTRDPLLKRQMLFRLSYRPLWSYLIYYKPLAYSVPSAKLLKPAQIVSELYQNHSSTGPECIKTLLLTRLTV